MTKTILLIVDVQKGMLENDPFDWDEVITNISRLIEACRKNKVEVVYVQHDGKPGSVFEPGKPGWEIVDAISPANDEKIFRKNFNSAFRRTQLKEYLDSKDVETIILTGLQTDFCIDTTCKVAFEFGYHLIMPEKTNTTINGKRLSAETIYNFYNEDIFRDRFAKIFPVSQVIEDYIDS